MLARSAFAVRPPTALIVTRDGGLFERIAAHAPGAWIVEACFDVRAVRGLVGERDVRLVVVDDEALSESERVRFLDQVHRLAPDAGIVYVASDHTPECERAVRSHGVLCYTSRPMDVDRLDRVVRAVFTRGPGSKGFGTDGAIL